MAASTLTNAELEDIIASTLAIATRLRQTFKARFSVSRDASQPARQQAAHEIFSKIAELLPEKHSAATAIAMMTLLAELVELQVNHDCQMIFQREQHSKPWN